MDDERFFEYSQNVFSFFGLWRDDFEKKPSFRALLSKYSIIFFMGGIIPIFSVTDIIAAARTESVWSALTKALYGFAFALCLHKVFAAGHNNSEIFFCIRKMEMMAHKFKDLTDFKECLATYSKMTKIGSLSVNLVGLAFMASPLVAHQFPYNPQLPHLDFTKSPNYEIMFIYQAISVMFVAHVMVAYDTTFCGLMSLCGGVLSSIRRDITQIKINRNNPQATEDSLKQVIEKITEVSNMVNQISDIFSLTTMSSILYNCVLMAFGLLTVSFIPLSDLSSIIMFFEIGVVTFQMWIYCYFGQTVVNERDLLQTELYCTKWYDGSKNFKTMILLSIFEAQKERYIKAGNILPLSLNTLTEILRKAYTFYTFFKRVAVERH